MRTADSYQRFLVTSNLDYKEATILLSKTLPPAWTEEYDKLAMRKTQILEIKLGSFTYLFDFQSNASQDEILEDRVVAVYGVSEKPSRTRDKNRMRGFLGNSSRVFGEGFDKGHFIAHSIGGGLDINLYPQSRKINQGTTKEGRVYRSMEKYCSLNPGVFCFSRPIYMDGSWRPSQIEFGLLKLDKSIWVEKFSNI